MVSQIGKELGGGHQGAVYELLDGKGKDSGQVLKVISIAEPCCHTSQRLFHLLVADSKNESASCYATLRTCY